MWCALAFSTKIKVMFVSMKSEQARSQHQRGKHPKKTTNNQSVIKVASSLFYKSRCKCGNVFFVCFFFFCTQVMCLLKNSCSATLVGFNSSRCRVWTTVGSKAAHELVEEAEEALQRVSPDTPTTWSMRVFLACSGASTISTVPYDGFSLRQRAAFKVKPRTAACETCTDKRTAVITNPNLSQLERVAAALAQPLCLSL